MGRDVCILIPTYNRPDVIKATLPSWLRARDLARIFVVADTSSKQKIDEYSRVLSGYLDPSSYTLHLGRRGSVNARNMLLKWAMREKCGYVLTAEDDYILPSPRFIRAMKEYLDRYRDVGAVGGRVIPLAKRAVDPDFFLNTPIPIADPITRLTGYIFLDVRNGPRYAEHLPHFFMMRGELLGKVWYSRVFETPSAFREESDLQVQIKRQGYRLLLEPRVFVYHLPVEMGGDRLGMNMGERIYWKAHNHARFIRRWFRSPLRQAWYIMNMIFILGVYSTKSIGQVFRGLKEGLR